MLFFSWDGQNYFGAFCQDMLIQTIINVHSPFMIDCINFCIYLNVGKYSV